MSWENYLKEIYFDPKNPASLSGPSKLYTYVKRDGKYDISKYKITKWLQQQEPYSLQRAIRKPVHRTPIIVAGIDDQWSADLMDMVKFSKHNVGTAYVLVVIDVFSKYLWLRPLKDKRGPGVAEAFKDIFKMGRKPQRIRTDKGQEFRAKTVQSLFNAENIQHFYALNEKKASVSERVLKTIKTKIYRYFTYKQSYRYIDKLQSFADGYNKTKHMTIDMAPGDVTKNNSEEVRLAAYFARHKKHPTIKKKWRFRFKVGDHVRITHLRNPFSREYDEKWTGEIFSIASRFWRTTVPIYRLKDYNGEDITGTFYQSELQKVYVDENSMWKVEKILRTQGQGRNKRYFVKWLRWPKQFNSWINASDVSNQ